jgi:hypothetical protein
MPRTAEVSIYQFDELSDSAKERARDWFRECNAHDTDWSDSTLEDAAKCGEILGIDFKHRQVRTVGGTTYTEPCILFSGFWSQGDGACFEGTYSYAKGCNRAIRRHAPTEWKNRKTGEVEISEMNTRLARIADGLVALQKKYGYRLTATVEHTGRYCHEYSTTIDVRQETSHGDDVILPEDEERMIELLRDFMRWIYKQLNDEWDYQNADEQVDDNIRANEYEFDEDGNRSRI